MLLSFDLIYSVAHGEVNAMDKTPMYEMSLTFVCLGFGVGEAIFSIGILSRDPDWLLPIPSFWFVILPSDFSMNSSSDTP